MGYDKNKPMLRDTFSAAAAIAPQPKLQPYQYFLSTCIWNGRRTSASVKHFILHLTCLSNWNATSISNQTVQLNAVILLFRKLSSHFFFDLRNLEQRIKIFFNFHLVFQNVYVFHGTHAQEGDKCRTRRRGGGDWVIWCWWYDATETGELMIFYSRSFTRQV